MRMFHFFYQEVVHMLGADLYDLIAARDICAQHAWTRRDFKELAELDNLICEQEEITIQEYDEWR
jgi:hypothetical protein